MSESVERNSGAWSYLRIIRGCRLCRFLATMVFCAIFAVELVILIPSYTHYREDLLNRLDFAGLSAIRTVIDVAPALLQDFDIAEAPDVARVALILNMAALRSDTIGGTPLLGGAIYNADGVDVGHFGAAPALALDGGDRAALSADGKYYDVMWTPVEDGLPYTVIGRLDARHVGSELRAFVFPVLGLLLLTSVVVCGVVMLIIGRYVLSPLLALEAWLKTAGAAPEATARTPLRPLRDDELGDVIVALTTATMGMVDNLVALRESREALAMANERLEQNVADRTRALIKSNRALAAEVEERKEAMDKANFLASHDLLTGLPNRMLFEDMLRRDMVVAQRKKTILALILLDVDNFIDIINTFGNRFSDALLQQVASRLRRTVRDHDIVAHLFGDEFAIVQTDLAAAEASAIQVRRLTRILSEPYIIDNRQFKAHASIAVALFPDNGQDMETLLKNAKLTMQRAKKSRGDGLAYFYDQNLEETVRQRSDLRREMRFALEKSQYRLHYQPKHRFADGRCVGAEALIRWEHPQRGMIYPSEFIPLAENTGLIRDIGQWALHEAARQFRDLRDHGDTSVVAVNLSAVQLRDCDLPLLVRKVLRDTDLAPCRLELEITESMAIDDIDQTVEALEALNAEGVGLSIDDFGTGYSSLSYLRQLPVGKMKIDRAFITDINSNEDAAAIVRAIVGLGQSLNLKTVAEGVETADQYRYLHDIGCTEAQGYFLSKPLPADAFEAYMQAHRA